MKRMLKELTKEEVSAIIEDSLSDYCCTVAKNGNRPFGLEGSINWVKTSPTVWSNFIYSAKFSNHEIDEQIKQVVARMESGELPNVWIVGPKSIPANLHEYLITYGFEKRYGMLGMAIDLMELEEKIDIPQNVEIRVVDSTKLLRQWTDIVSQGLFDGDIFELCLFEDLIKDSNFKFYVALYNGEAVASSMLQISTGVASIDMVATLHKCRRMGIGTAMTLMPLLDARKTGYTIGVLQASQAGIPTYRKMGFKEYCNFHEYKYRNNME